MADDHAAIHAVADYRAKGKRNQWHMIFVNDNMVTPKI
jgi:hypothetical protein